MYFRIVNVKLIYFTVDFFVAFDTHTFFRCRSIIELACSETPPVNEDLRLRDNAQRYSCNDDYRGCATFCMIVLMLSPVFCFVEYNAVYPFDQDFLLVWTFFLR